MIDWDKIVADIGTKEGVDITTDPARWNLDTPGYNEIYSMWKAANFNAASIKWTNYYPEQHFSESVVKSVADDIGLTGVHRSWISKIDPGYMAPWHWDVDDNEQAYLTKGTIWRYTVFIQQFAHGHVFILGDEYYYNQPKNKIIPWNNYKEWHSGINAGMEPNYMLHILGYKS